MADAVLIPGAGGRSGETLLILGILGAGAFVLWRRGMFDKPAPRQSTPAPTMRKAPGAIVGGMKDPALPVGSQLGNVPPVAQALTDAQRNYLAQGGATTAGSIKEASSLIQQGAPAVTTTGAIPMVVKPPPVTAMPGVVATARPVGLPSPFGKKAVFTVVNKPAAAPAPLAIAPTPPAPKPTPIVAPTSPNLTIAKAPVTLKTGFVAAPLAKPSTLSSIGSLGSVKRL
jgi:hypothetical protein